MQKQGLIYANTLRVYLEMLSCCFGSGKSRGTISPRIILPHNQMSPSGGSCLLLGIDLVGRGLHKTVLSFHA